MSFIGFEAGSILVADVIPPVMGGEKENFSHLYLHFHPPGLKYTKPNTFTFQGEIRAPSGQPTSYGRPGLTESEMIDLGSVFDFKISPYTIKNADWAKNWAKEETIKFLEKRANPVKLIEWTNLRDSTYVLVNVGSEKNPASYEELDDVRKNIVNWLGKEVDLVTHHAIKIKVMKLKKDEKVHFLIGNDNRPAGELDIQEFKIELENSITEMRPIVTHHSVKMRKYKF